GSSPRRLVGRPLARDEQRGEFAAGGGIHHPPSLLLSRSRAERAPRAHSSGVFRFGARVAVAPARSGPHTDGNTRRIKGRGGGPPCRRPPCGPQGGGGRNALERRLARNCVGGERRAHRQLLV